MDLNHRLISMGVGIVIEKQEGYSISLSKDCFIFTAEVTAIATALKIIDCKENNKDDFIIFSDSKCVLKAINNNCLSVYQKKYILEIKRLHTRFKKRSHNRVIFVWIPSHYRITGNEQRVGKGGFHGTGGHNN